MLLINIKSMMREKKTRLINEETLNRLMFDQCLARHLRIIRKCRAEKSVYLNKWMI